eukprot:CAMPEP_0117556688 /NCGR_PEP_ID=MMETSP0784-20121206/51939_1 /TAXON_ID=39447 /ORGANISM="" /LENGTH=47 /DNA_ID= /DNA_START= /DNA_END= /DNA_ORIENTATION=
MTTRASRPFVPSFGSTALPRHDDLAGGGTRTFARKRTCLKAAISERH